VIPEGMQSEGRFTEKRKDCPDPSRWHSPDSDSTEFEVSRWIAATVGALRPDLVVETGTAFGQTAALIGEILGEVPHGTLMTFETDPARVKIARERVMGMRVEVHEESSLDGLKALAHLVSIGQQPKVGFAWLDSLFELRAKELRIVTPMLSPGALVGIHDCGEPDHTKYNPFSRQIATEAKRLGYSRMSLPTPRGVTMLQKW
jgi:predicted O-methyltransferase YrrM